MRSRLFIVALAGLLVASCRPAANDYNSPAAQQDLGDMQGTWEIVSAQASGADATKACQERSPKLTFQGPGWLQQIDGQSLYTEDNSHIRLDPAKSPKQFDHLVRRTADGQSTMVAYPGIYELNGDSLTLCWDVGLKQRPTKFESDTSDEFFLVKLKRVASGP